MKLLKSQKIGLVAVGVLYGFALGIFTCLAFIFESGQIQSGVALLVAILCSLAATVLQFAIRGELHRDIKIHEEHDT